MGELLIKANITHEDTDGFYTDAHIEVNNLNPQKFNKIMVKIIHDALSDYADGNKINYLIGLLDFELEFKKLMGKNF